MGSYTTRSLDNTEYHEIIKLIRDGYLEHRPNPQIATVLVLEANLGCRIGDILKLRTDSFIYDGGIWKIRIIEQKTKKERCFIVPKQVKQFIDKWIDKNGITTGNLFTISAQAVWKALRQVTDFLEMENVSTHSLRKFAANNLYNASGHDIEAVCAFLQHSDTKITRTYIRRSDEQLERAIQASVSMA